MSASLPSVPSGESSPVLDLPAWFNQGPEQVANASRLRAFFLQPEFEDTDLINDIRDQLPLSAALVDDRVNDAARPYPWPFADDKLTLAFPEYDQVQRARKTANQVRIATEATRLLVAAALWKMLPPQGDKQFIANAAADGNSEALTQFARIGSADDLLRGLCKSVGEIAQAIDRATHRRSGRGVILTGRGDYS